MEMLAKRAEWSRVGPNRASGKGTFLCCFVKSSSSHGSGEELDHFSDSLRPLMDNYVLWCLFRFFHQHEGLQDCCFLCSCIEPLQILKQHHKCIVWGLKKKNNVPLPYRIG
ncbi:hypothetical protein ILYODFUR_037527 [Ilyodon furcidens]|uniref:Uncharacterized protein n=1 Tax=Ilyodon furcidens TaxID=33524 RepID=A0ABV0V9C9_9TELE